MAPKTTDPRTGEPKYPRFVAFFGPDGAGKSTQALLLIGFLRANGLKVKQAWVRSVHTFAFLLWNIFARLNLCRNASGLPLHLRKGFAISYLNESPYGVVSPINLTPPVLKGPISKLMWATIEVISILPVVLLQVYVPLFLKYSVVAERYIIDSIVSIAYFLNDETFVNGRLANLLLSFVPKGTIFVFIDADYSTIFNRRGEEAGPSEYTDFHRKSYARMKEIVHAYRIDTTKCSIEEAHEKVLSLIQKVVDQKPKESLPHVQSLE